MEGRKERVYFMEGRKERVYLMEGRKERVYLMEGRQEGKVLFNDALKCFYLWITYGKGPLR